MSTEFQWEWPQAEAGSWLYSIHKLRRVRVTLERLRNSVGKVNPRPSGWHNDLMQLVKRLFARWLAWYTGAPLREYGGCISRLLPEVIYAIENLSTNMVALEWRLAEAERKATTLADGMQAQLKFLHEQVKTLVSLQRTAHLQARQHSLPCGGEKMSEGSQWDGPQADPGKWLYRIDELQHAGATLEELRNNVGIVHARPAGWRNGLMQLAQQLLARLLTWYARPLWQFNACINQLLQEILCGVANLCTKMAALELRLAEVEEKTATLTEQAQEQLEFLYDQVPALGSSQPTAHLQARQHPLPCGGEKMSDGSQWNGPRADPGKWLYSIDELRHATATLEELSNNVGIVHARPVGWRNGLTQLVQKLLARLLAGYVRPMWAFNACVSRLLQEIFRSDEDLSTNMAAVEMRLAEAERRTAELKEPMQEHLDFLHGQVKALVSLRQINSLRALASGTESDWGNRGGENSTISTDVGLKYDRTAYILGLFGTGRLYINVLIQQNIGEREKYFRDFIRLHPGPTSMIYSGHATMRHISRSQAPPQITRGILEAVRSRFADLIFLFRHPLDSLVTNWVWWRTYIRDHKPIRSVSEVYRNTDELCADLEQNYAEFEAFAEGDPAFYAAVPGQRFLSFPEYVEETELFFQAATLTLRLEDFMADPAKEFSKIAEVMSIDIDLNGLCIPRPRAEPYRYLEVEGRISRFRSFISGLDALTRERIEKIGYSVGV